MLTPRYERSAPVTLGHPGTARPVGTFSVSSCTVFVARYVNTPAFDIFTGRTCSVNAVPGASECTAPISWQPEVIVVALTPIISSPTCTPADLAGDGETTPVTIVPVLVDGTSHPTARKAVASAACLASLICRKPCAPNSSRGTPGSTS